MLRETRKIKIKKLQKMKRATRSDTCYSLPLVTSLCTQCSRFRDKKNIQGRAVKVGAIPTYENIWDHKQKQRHRIEHRQQELQEMNGLNLCFYNEDQKEIESNSRYQIQR